LNPRILDPFLPINWEKNLKIFLDIAVLFNLRNIKFVQALVLSLIGNPVKIGGEPVAVIGDESCEYATVRRLSWMGRRSY